MPSYKLAADFSGLRERTKNMIEKLGNPDLVLRPAMANLYAGMSERIQQDGRKTDGSPIQDGFSGSSKREGAYSKPYARKRKKAGRQTSKMDLTNSGDLMDRGFMFFPDGPKSYALGFLNRREYDKAEGLETMFGPIFSPSKEERAQAIKDIINGINKLV